MNTKSYPKIHTTATPTAATEDVIIQFDASAARLKEDYFGYIDFYRQEKSIEVIRKNDYYKFINPKVSAICCRAKCVKIIVVSLSEWFYKKSSIITFREYGKTDVFGKIKEIIKGEVITKKIPLSRLCGYGDSPDQMYLDWLRKHIATKGYNDNDLIAIYIFKKV